MADFRQLALDFVLGDDEAKLTSIAQQASAELQNASANTNPVARWVEAVQPWMPGSGPDDMVDENQDTPDWTARAKALEFLSRTLQFVTKDTLRRSQVDLLVHFFGAMFDIDHKAGILPSAKALSRIHEMKSFNPQSGSIILEKICLLKDDFPRQIAKTRLAVYQLLQSLITDPAVAKDLQQKDGEQAVFMHNLLHLCSNERDPDCLMVWFGLLKHFLVEYPATQEILEEVYGAFKAYFPITLPRISDSGITPDELKMQLRNCFSANSRLAASTLPFLLGKLDQGDGVTVNVKIDVLKSIKACVEQYESPKESVNPYADRIWTSLKYEVRNGEIEDTIWATLEVLKSVAMKLKGDELRDYALSVTRDCVNDLSSAMYAAPSGRLLVSVLSANASAYVLMVAPTITHLKENLRHPKSSNHNQDLLRILRIILETRLLLIDADIADGEKAAFAAVDMPIKSLYTDVYKQLVNLGCNPSASADDMKVAAEAVQGAAALVCQQQLSDLPIGETVVTSRLLPEETCTEICDSLLEISLLLQNGQGHTTEEDELINETAKSLQRAVRGFEPGFQLVITKGLDIIDSEIIKQDARSAANIKSLLALLAFVTCSELPTSPTEGMRRFLSVFVSLHEKLVKEVGSNGSPQIWCSLAGGLQSTVRYFRDACLQQNPQKDLSLKDSATVGSIIDRYCSSDSNSKTTLPEIWSDFLLVTLFLTARLYCQTVERVRSPDGTDIVCLTAAFGVNNSSLHYQYLYLISDLASFVLREMNETQQSSLTVQGFVGELFNGMSSQQMGQFIFQRSNILVLGVLQALRPSVVAELFDYNFGQSLLLSGCTVPPSGPDVVTKSATASILAILANKYKIETLESVMAQIEQNLSHTLQVISTASNMNDRVALQDQVSAIYAVTAGMLRRYSGKQAQGILQLLRSVPKDVIAGGILARRLETIVAPQPALSKDNYGIIKPLWVQKTYIELVKPMLQSGISAGEAVQDATTKSNFDIAVLRLVKHMNFSIYEEDADQILRVAISTAQSADSAADKVAALQVLKTVLVEDSEKVQTHLRSLVNICTASPSSREPVQLSQTAANDISTLADKSACQNLALEILGGLPKLFESRHLLPYVPQVERNLAIACGHRVREVRKSARSARVAWSVVN